MLEIKKRPPSFTFQCLALMHYTIDKEQEKETMKGQIEEEVTSYYFIYSVGYGYRQFFFTTPEPARM